MSGFDFLSEPKYNPGVERRVRILCIPDGPDWIFNRHVSYLRRHLGTEFEFSVAYRGQEYDESVFDLIYPLEFDMVTDEQIDKPEKYVTGIRSFVSWVDWNFLTLINFLITKYGSVHVVSRQLYDLFSPYIPNLWYVTHGVDTQFFSPSTYSSSESGHLRIGWAGNRDTIVKGFRDFIQPLAEIPNVELVYCGYADRHLTAEEMVDFYNSLDAYICTSSFEGNNNSLLEAASMERAIITTSNGTVTEYLVDRHSALIVERNLEQIRDAVVTLRDDSELRIRLGKQARQALIDGGWDWKEKAEEYRHFFRNALVPKKNKPSQIASVRLDDFQHYASVLHTQYVLERELRIGYKFQSIELDYRLKGYEQELKLSRQELQLARQELQLARQELQLLKESETYKLAERVKSFRIIQVLIWLYNRYMELRSE